MRALQYDFLRVSVAQRLHLRAAGVLATSGGRSTGHGRLAPSLLAELRVVFDVIDALGQRVVSRLGKGKRQQAADDRERAEDDERDFLPVRAEVQLLQVGYVRVDDAAEPPREGRQACAGVPAATGVAVEPLAIVQLKYNGV